MFTAKNYRPLFSQQNPAGVTLKLSVVTGGYAKREGHAGVGWVRAEGVGKEKLGVFTSVFGG